MLIKISLTFHLTTVRMAKIKKNQITISDGVDIEKRNVYSHLGRMQTSTNTVKVSQITEIHKSCDLAVPLLNITQRTLSPMTEMLFIHVHCCSNHSSQKMGNRLDAHF